MVIMTQSNSSGMILMRPGSAVELDMMSDDEPPISMLKMMRSYRHLHQQHASVGGDNKSASFANQTKRNKRKNFQPRSIAHEPDPRLQQQQQQQHFVAGEGSRRQRRTSSADSINSSDYALDLTNNEEAAATAPAAAQNREPGCATADELPSPVCRNDRNRESAKAPTIDDMCCDEDLGDLVDDDDDGDEDDEEEEEDEEEDYRNSYSAGTAVSPIDLSYSAAKAESSYSESDSEDEMDKEMPSSRSAAISGRKYGLTTSAPSLPPPPSSSSSVAQSAFFLHRQQFFSQSPPEATDLKEYAQNTVKELLEIYGLNGDAVTDVTQTITNNVPISNFNSGKILSSLRLAGVNSAAVVTPIAQIAAKRSDPNCAVRLEHGTPRVAIAESANVGTEAMASPSPHPPTPPRSPTLLANDGRAVANNSSSMSSRLAANCSPLPLKLTAGVVASNLSNYDSNSGNATVASTASGTSDVGSCGGSLSGSDCCGTDPDKEDAPPTSTTTTTAATSLVGTQQQQQQQQQSSSVNVGKQKLFDISFPPPAASRQHVLPPPPPPMPSLAAAVQTPPTLSAATHRMVLPQNMAAILALASMKEQMKLVNNVAAVDISGRSSTLSPSVSSMTSNISSSQTYNDSSNPGSLSITRIPLSSPPLMKDGKPLSSPSTIDYSRYVKRYSTSAECGSSYCKDLNFREHFHCLDCNSRVFMKKEEMIRHFKWHKKRDESLQHGFMRYSPSDDCSDRFQNCTHNRKQTHYHCIQGTCDKVYISTSDVQMHANYHRKDSAIIQEGFQRLRATEECRTPYCAFYGQRTTHFHCRRDQCQFTFKNKADMEKHKTYHIKDEQLARDGFKKFLKPDACGFPSCRFSQVCNHIHCVRDGCSYVLHSSGQLLSHKRKHERKDTEIAYRKFKLNQQSIGNFINSEQLNSQVSDLAAAAVLGLSPSRSNSLHQQSHLIHSAGATSSIPSSYSLLHDNSYSNSSSDGGGGCLSPNSGGSTKQSVSQHFGLRSPGFLLNSAGGIAVSSSANSPAVTSAASVASMNAPTSQSGGFFTENSSVTDYASDEVPDYWYRYISHYESHEGCFLGSKCILYATEHYHCKEANCDFPFRNKEMAESHARMHEAQERLTESIYQEGANFCQDGSCPREKHYHCTWEGCYEAILPNERIDHLRNHEITTSQYNSLDALFRRKRGRPPKNRIIEVWNDYGGISGNDSPQAIFTSFKLPKPNVTVFANSFQQQTENDASSPTRIIGSPKHLSEQFLEQHKFEEYTDGCPDPLCAYSTLPIHYHCRRPKCFFAADVEEDVVSHSTDFHENVEILDGFLFFDSSVDCRLENCPSNKINRHFHCVRPGCGYSFIQYSSMVEHINEHRLSNSIAVKLTPEKEKEEKSTVPESPPLKRRNSSPVSQAQLQSSVSNSVTPTPSLPSPPLEPPSSRSTTVVKASGTFYPLCSINNVRSSSPASSIEEKTKSDSATGESQISSPSLIPQWLQVERHERYTTERPCCRAFCKLKRKDHYHCNACNQAFSEVEKLKPHILKHNTNTLVPFGTKQENNNNNEETENIHSPGMVCNTSLGVEMQSEMAGHPYSSNFNVAMAAAQHLALMTSQGIPFIPHAMPTLYTSPSGLMFAAAPGFNAGHHSIIGNGLLESMSHTPLSSDSTNSDATTRRSCSPQRDMSPEMKKARIQNSMRILKDEPVPEGYLRFRFNEDCHYTHCGYREHQTHFHCVRNDCGYSFCDKTRFVQHTARHERLDTLMGGDFQQYRANISCGRSDCVYTASIGSGQNKASHFHCLKCEFVCTDTNKVVAHRRQHQKLDSIMAAGFEKFTPSQSCSQPDTCVHSGKQTHYHCLSCQYAVLGLSQMTAHKYRHME